MKMRPVDPGNQDEEDPGDCHMTWDDFVSSCESNSFIDYDGFGEFATATHVSDETIKPSEVVAPGFVKPEWVTHVVWYNK